VLTICPRCRCIFILAIAFCAALPRGYAVTFVTQQNPGFLPDYDPDGRKLLDVMSAAANRYSHILRDSWVINLEVRYAEPGTMSSLAFAAPTATLEFDPVGHPNAIRAVGGRVTFNPGVQWFLDPTPF